MSSTLRMWTEIVFNIGYLVIIWVLISKMFKRADTVTPKDIPVACCMMMAFILLALGDTGHVGFRTLAYYLGGLDSRIIMFGIELPLVGLGALATAVTITFFYIVMLDAWRKRFDVSYGAFEYVLIVAAIVRLILFIHPGNKWFSVIPPFGWSVARNISLMLLGLGVACLILRDGFRYKDRMFKLMGLMIVISFACYIPVIFLVQKIAWVGMLMIPKTLAYIAMAIIAYEELYNNSQIVVRSSHTGKGM